MLLTDSSKQEAGVMDFVYVCKKQPFSITCSPYLPKTEENYVDMDLVLRMNIPIKNIQCTRLHYAGHHTRVVGQISQTVQCVVAGKAKGTAHLKAKVVRDLTKLFQADCVAGVKLYKNLMDPSFHSSKEVHHNTRNKISPAFKPSTGTKDTYTNISTVIVNDTCDDDGPSQKKDNDSIASDAELSAFLAKMTDDAQADAIADYPELANYIKEDKAASDDDDLRIFLSTQSEDAKLQAVSDYPELERILQKEKDVQLPHRTHDPVLAAILKQGLGPTDARIMSMSANMQPHMLSSLPASNHHLRQVMVDSSASALSYPSNYASDLGKLPHPVETKDIQHGYHDDQVSLKNLEASYGYHDDQVSLRDLAASHGYYDVPSEPDQDQVSLHSDTAEFFCRLCQRSDQPDIITFSHDFMDPSCPSMLSAEEDDALES